jgi:hypothetical protein
MNTTATLVLTVVSVAQTVSATLDLMDALVEVSFYEKKSK